MRNNPHTAPATLTDPAWWEQTYADRPRWDIGRPQPVFAELAEAGAFQGRVLDVGCGTGEHVLLAATLGLDAVGIDLAERPLAIAREKAKARGLTARFLRHDVRRLPDLGESFDTVLDCGLFHIFTGDDRDAYVHAVTAATNPGGRYFLLSFLTHPGAPDRRVTPDLITACFSDGWRVDAVETASLDSTIDPDGIPALLARLTRR